jgi:endonuclease/exonuclease/phosphatase family metal-dependent hydrolase
MVFSFSIRPFRILFPAAMLLLATGVEAQSVSGRSAIFYNVENLFDTENDPASDDGDFTPEGAYGWTAERLTEKTGRIVQVLREASADLAGLAEVENAAVVEGLARHPDLAALHYDFVHFDSPDERGIDVALLYRRSAFRVEAMRPLRYRLLPQYRSRELLLVSGQWRGHPAHVLVCHLPSVISSNAARRGAAESLRGTVDSLVAADPGHLIVVMGDFNANPGDRTMRTLTSGSALQNPFEALYRKGYGTYLYRGRWNMYDAILVGGMIPGVPQARVFIRDHLIQTGGMYHGYPYRSFSGTEYIGGYSDHLPVGVGFVD